MYQQQEEMVLEKEMFRSKMQTSKRTNCTIGCMGMLKVLDPGPDTAADNMKLVIIHTPKNRHLTENI